ncbi:hypothetical protein CC78DRAFT_601328 [Lojkania enalia]|uniref:Uncharacterized protein n=1 Tax=Lojkania enalia TaxID=147567 RepID=A0A9P4N6F4_9PLEO|nr:hypothetical protein CC78DRAFT_601328 [Didymosphaeria enalia]
MADSPDPTTHYTTSPSPSGGATAETAIEPPSELGVPEQPSSRPESPQQQYKFIMTTGDESATTRKRNLKTVRSQVMKNYLAQQQQRQGRGPNESLSSGSSERRKEKQRARSSRSRSREVDSLRSLTVGERGTAGMPAIGSLPPRFSWASGFGGTEQPRIGSNQPFALDFTCNIPQDEISKSAQSYVSSLFNDKRAGLLEPSFQTLNSKGETVAIVKDTLGVFGNDVSESMIFAVSLLAFGCAVECEWDGATGHLEALQRIIDGHGGIDTLDFELQRSITWTTYCLAAAMQLPPHFPVPQFPNAGQFSLAFLDDAQIRAWRTVKRFPKNNSFVFDVVVRLHQLGLATSSEYSTEVDQKAVSNLYFEALHKAIILPGEEPWNANIPSGSQGQEMATMFKVWAAGMPIYIWATERHLRNRLGHGVIRLNFDPVLSRVRGILEDSGGYQGWPRGKSLEPILATLFYCVECCDFANPWRMWCLDAMRKIREMLKLNTVDEFKKALEFFPSTEEFRKVADDIWRELLHHGSLGSSQGLAFSPLQ